MHCVGMRACNPSLRHKVHLCGVGGRQLSVFYWLPQRPHGGWGCRHRPRWLNFSTQLTAVGGRGVGEGFTSGGWGGAVGLTYGVHGKGAWSPNKHSSPTLGVHICVYAKKAVCSSVQPVAADPYGSGTWCATVEPYIHTMSCTTPAARLPPTPTHLPCLPAPHSAWWPPTASSRRCAASASASSTTA